ncbi:MAG: helix-turn-helix transcriptional regulator [Pirellulales bacterium]|nr:helix-turn-helix transcriptional regulator [Pirellulales bacterium]
MEHSDRNPLVTLHDSRGRIVFAQPLVFHSAAEVLYSQPWEWVATETERIKIRDAFQKVLFDREPITIRATFVFRGQPTLYECHAVPVDTNDVTVMTTSVPILEEDEEVGLTPREHECLRQLIAGQQTAEIALEMGVKATTVITYKQRLKDKIGVDSLAGLIAWGCRHIRS